MNFRLAFIAIAACSSLFLVAGCGSKTQVDAGPKGKGFVRFVNVSGEEIETNDGRGNARPQLAHGEISPRRSAPEGPMTLKVIKDKKELYSQTLQIQPDVVYTLYSFIGPDGKQYKVFENDPQRADKGEIVIRLLNLVDGETASASTAGGLETPIGEEVAGIGAGTEAKLAPGRQSLQVKVAGKTIKVPDFPTASGEAYTLIVHRKKDGSYAASVVRNSASMQISSAAPTAG
ncbi:MAG: hypothetical protein WAO58_09830 [Fimbriimonadaceae bacterium]